MLPDTREKTLALIRDLGSDREFHTRHNAPPGAGELLSQRIKRLQAHLKTFGDEPADQSDDEDHCIYKLEVEIMSIGKDRAQVSVTYPKEVPENFNTCAADIALQIMHYANNRTFK